MSYFEKVSFERWKSDCGVKGLKDKDLKEWYDAIKLPAQATAASAGCDFFMPFNLNFESGSKFRIATGIRWVCDEGERDRVLLVMPRSGLGFKYGIRLSNTVGVIEENPSAEHVQLHQGKPFAQGIVVKYEIPEGAASDDERNGGFGSTDK